MIMTLAFLVSAILLMLITLIEIGLAGGVNEMTMQSSLPWLIAGWCIWLATFYAYRKWGKIEEYDDGYDRYL